MGNEWKWALGIGGFIVLGLVYACTSLVSDTPSNGLEVSRAEIQTRYEALGVEFDVPEILADGRRSVTGKVESSSGVSVAVELVGPVENLTEITIATVATEMNAIRYLSPVLVEVLEFAPDHIEKSSRNMFIGATRGGPIALQGVTRPVVGELSVTPELGLLILNVEAAMP